MTYTSHVSLTDARRDLLATIADFLEERTPLHPLVRLDAISAFRALVTEHDLQAIRHESAIVLSDREAAEAEFIAEEIAHEDTRERWAAL